MNEEMHNLYDALWGQKGSIITKLKVKVPQAKNGISPGYKMTIPQCVSGDLTESNFLSTPEEHSFKAIKLDSDLKAVLPCGVKKLLVRPEYEEIYDRVMKVEAGRWTRDGKRQRCWNEDESTRLDFLLSGQPGTGKTYFLSYLLVRRLMKRKPTVYRTSDNMCFLFDEKSHGDEITLHALARLDRHRMRKLWILTDERITDPVWNMPTASWFIVLAASPKKVEASNDWKKKRTPEVYFMSPWKWAEMFAAYSLRRQEPPTDDQIKRLLLTWVCFGPVARTCLKIIKVNSDKEYHDTFRTYLALVDLEISGFVSKGRRESLDHTVHFGSSHKIVLMQPTNAGTCYTAQIITRWIAYRVYEMALKHSQQDCFLLFKHLSLQPGLRSAAGSFFEGYVHDWFRLGGTFTACEIAISQTTKELLEFKTVGSKFQFPNYFSTAEDLLSQVKPPRKRHGIDPSAVGKYFIPVSRNYEAIDALLFQDSSTLLCFQITIAKQHSIKSYGLKKLLGVLPKTIKKIYMIFVVPESCEKDYCRKQDIPTSADITPSPSSVLQIKQFRLVFSDDKIKSVVVEAPIEMQEDNEHKEDKDDNDNDESDYSWNY